MRKMRVVTATALFDGHDVSINIFRRLLQKKGLEVIHLGHNRSVTELVLAAVEEDADAVLVSSYQGGHNEYFRYMIDLLKEKGAGNVLVFGGGGGVILPSEIIELEEYGVEQIYHADTGKKIGITGIADDIVARIQRKVEASSINDVKESDLEQLTPGNKFLIGKLISRLENAAADNEQDRSRDALREKLADGGGSIVLGITGTGGSGKSSLVDELINRFLKVSPDVTVGVLAVDPSKTASGGALLGDRIRLNSFGDDRLYLRSFATRESYSELSLVLPDAIRLLKTAGFDVIIIETSGIGQGASKVTEICDHSIYVMTSEYGAPSQLDKIDMLDLADSIVINKCEKIGAEDALREVILHRVKDRGMMVNRRKQRSLFELDLPIYATNASQFNNQGVNAFFADILKFVSSNGTGFTVDEEIMELLPTEGHKDFSALHSQHNNYLAEIADTVKNYHRQVEQEAAAAETCYSLNKARQTVRDEGVAADNVENELTELYQRYWRRLSRDSVTFLENWPGLREDYKQEQMSYTVRGKKITVDAATESLSGTMIPKVALPQYRSWGDLIRFFYKENLPGYFPYTAGVFPFKRTFEDPKRQFAGEGPPEKTNKRFHYLCRNDQTKRLSVAFDGLTLYGQDPDISPDIYGKIGESGVSICTLDDMKKLFAGFDLSDPHTSVSMTINGPAPIILAMYFMTACHQQGEKRGHDLSQEEKIDLFRCLRGTVQADILKEDQGQNTCIFSIDFALKMMGNIQAYFSRLGIKNYYTISISGYHIAEAGANPVTQLAFTLANGFHYVEYFKNLGLKVDDFARNLSFFFSNGMEPEYSVIGRVARRIWAVAMRDKYGAAERSQKLKYHIQTSGRSLHAQEIAFNDIRTTLQALLAFYDNCNSLHTNSYDEAVTTPTEESVRRAMAIQVILSKEFGLLKNENISQGSFIIEELTDLVEEAVLEEFYRLSFRGGVIGSMEKQYQRAKIQEESLYYEELKHSGEYPIVGVNTYLADTPSESPYEDMVLTRSTPEEKQSQLDNLESFKETNKGKCEEALRALKKVVLEDGNIFEELLNTVQYASLGQISGLLYEIGGKYRRNV
ncbi:MAG: methylmalonyl-CoA mutase family protein [bacterium]|jgi:methylmalonyl-CoA mutase|nr:methylmalonyl-CoA mutase family protein [bacterium]